MSLPAAPKVPPQVAEQAVRWLVELQGDADDERLRQAWQRWRQAAPEHEQAWRHIEAVNQRLAGIGTPLALAAINAPHSPQRRRALKTLLLVLAAGGSAWGLRESGSLQRWSADYATGVGERRRLALADGSRLELNSDTAVDVRFDAGERRLLLLRGEIQLSTGHDPRPLHVYSAEGRLRPVGTRFDVRQFAGRTRVAVHEGAVQVENHAGQGLLLPSGRQLDFDRERLGVPQPLPVGSGAWTDGMLVAAGMRLDEFLAEVARYRPGRLGCAPRIGGLRISGSYPLDDSERILATLPAVLPVEVRRVTRYWVGVHPRE
ncbi:FecR family protein [Pseudomonas aeruginosa]|nr:MULTISPECIES: FecR family protein [Pseudomonas]MBG4215045.1 FecR family protein [Pseudomonas aeruginosa]MBG5822457.1 FecR family protein [Pseudomonas aeruginosa]MBI8455642.1 FecR family protein [Pseudomonas aeruginosa]MBO7964772.1 FecR family protein [Pseudomonas aeruginosa]MDV6696695.1 FecR family protein [Pseudomonas aeruginosa]